MKEMKTKLMPQKGGNKFLVRASGENLGDEKPAPKFCRPNWSAASASSAIIPPLESVVPSVSRCGVA
jgi:hypothetical protein